MRLRALALLAVFTCALAGCSALPGEKDTHASAILDFERGSAALPLDDYRADLPAFQAKYRHALALDVDACLAAQGLSTQADSVDWSASAPRDAREFGVWSLPLAERDGPEPGPLTNYIADVGFSPSPEHEAASKRCVEAAEPRFAAVTNLIHGNDPARRLAEEAAAAVAPSSEGSAFFARIENCLTEADIPIDEASRRARYPSMRSDPERARAYAVIDARCAVETGAIQGLFDLEAVRQSELLGENREELEATRGERQRIEADLDRLIAEGEQR